MGLITIRNNHVRATVTALVILIPLFLAVATLPHYPSASTEQVLGLAVFVTAIILWITELIPLPATALLIPVLTIVYGIFPADDAFRPFSRSIIFLFLGAFFLAQAMHKHRLDERIAYMVLLSPLGRRSFVGLALAVGSICFVFSMWISNTATAAMMCPVILGVARVFSHSLGVDRAQRVTIFLLLLVAYSSTAGGVATPVGSPPNFITIAFLEEHGVTITFFRWMAFALPISLTLFAAIFATLYFRYARDIDSIDVTALQPEFVKRRDSLGPLSAPELSIMCVFFLTVSLWIAPGILSFAFPESQMVVWFENHLPMSAVAVAAGVSLFFLPAKRQTDEAILQWADGKKIDWGTILLFGGGLSLGAMLEQTELSQHIGHSLFGPMATSPLLLIMVATATAILLTEVASNTASATVLVALLLGILPSGGELQAYGAVLAACLATSCSFMLPVATPPNAIVFGTEQVPLSEMLRVGAVLNVAALCIIVLFVRLFVAA